MAETSPLDVFIGTWSTTGRFVSPLPGEPETMTATDSYEWLPGNAHILHKAEAHMGDDGPSFTNEIMGYAADGALEATAYGGDGSVAHYIARLEDLGWEIDGETERFRGAFSADGQKLTGRWELRDNGDWRPWLDIELVKQR